MDNYTRKIPCHAESFEQRIILRALEIFSNLLRNAFHFQPNDRLKIS